MPILEYHLLEDSYSEEQCEKLLLESTRLYAEVMKCPLERIRVLIHLHKRSMVAVAGQMLNKGGQAAPYFHFLVLQGRPLEEKHKLLIGFTDLVVRILDADRRMVRGGCWVLPPEDWAIGGVPASVLRSQEILARSKKAENTGD